MSVISGKGLWRAEIRREGLQVAVKAVSAGGAGTPGGGTGMHCVLWKGGCRRPAGVLRPIVGGRERLGARSAEEGELKWNQRFWGGRGDTKTAFSDDESGLMYSLGLETRNSSRSGL